MADKKISALTASATPLAGTEVLPIVQSGSTVKVSVANLTAGRGVSGSSFTTTAGNFVAAENFGLSFGVGSTYVYGSTTSGFIRLDVNNATAFGVDSSRDAKVNVGNLIIGTAGKGIDFSANTHAAGMTSELLNWYEEGTFTPTFTGFTVGNGSVFGFYRRIGKQVFVTYGFILGSTSAVGSLTGLSGLPFTTGTVGASRFFNATGVAFKQGVGGFPAYALLYSASTTGSGPASTNTNTGMSATAPFVWATDDSLSFTATYFVD